MGIGEFAGRIGKVVSHEIGKAVELIAETRKGYNQKGVLYNSSGEDSPPVKSDKLVLLKIDGTGKYAVVGIFNESQGAKPGEKIFYARNEDGGIKSKLSMLGDGNVKLEGENLNIEITGAFNHESDDINFNSAQPIGLNDGLYCAGLQPYFSSENSALTALQTAATAAAAQLGVLDGLSGGAALAALGSAIAAFCGTMINADSAADTSISQVVK